VQDGVNIDARAEVRGESLLPCPLDDLGDREVRPVWVLAMKEGGGQPYIIGDLQFVPGFAGVSGLCCLSHKFNVCLYQTKVKTPRRRLPDTKPVVERYGLRTRLQDLDGLQPLPSGILSSPRLVLER